MKVIFVLAITIMTSCHFNPNPDNSILALTKNPKRTLYKVTEKPSDSLLIGTWEVDSFSYQFMQEHTDMKDKHIMITLDREGTLTSKNLPKFSEHNFEKLSSFISPKGTWRLDQSYKKDR